MERHLAASFGRMLTTCSPACLISIREARSTEAGNTARSRSSSRPPGKTLSTSRVAPMTGDTARVEKYKQLRREIATAFNRELWVADKGLRFEFASGPNGFNVYREINLLGKESAK